MTGVLQLKIELRGITPKIWRRFLVKDNIRFQDLHDFIQVVMDWGNYHLYEFHIGDINITSNEDEFNPAEASFKKLSSSPEFFKMLEQTDLKKGSASLDINKLNKILKDVEKNRSEAKYDMTTKISELIKSKGQKFYYIYDFGDNWEHSLVVEKIFSENDMQDCPICLSGERACPPEDCGGVLGYDELMKIKKNKKHAGYKEMITEWLGEDFDFEMFDISLVNKALKNVARKK